MSRRQQSVLTVLLILLLCAPVPGRAAEATMTFTGTLDVVGLLSAISVQPASVTVPAGGEVSFVNATSVTLKVKVGGKSTRVEPGGSASMRFTGADRAETFTATATARKLPVVGALTSSVGRITVQALPADADPAAPRSSTAPNGAAPTGEADPDRAPDQPDDPFGTADDDSDGTTRGGEVVPLAPSSSTSARPGGSSPAASPGSRGGEDDQGSDDDGDDDGSDGGGAPDSGGAAPEAKRADAEVEPVLPPFPGFTSAHDQLGLVFLLGAVVLAGLGAALFRTVLAFRPVVEVGAHSQAASRARKARRRRA